MNGAPRFAGAEVVLGGIAYTAAPLSLGAVKRLVPRIEAYGQLGLPEQIDVAIEVLHASLARNHSDITREQIEDVVDLGNMQQLFTSVLEVSGFAPTNGAAAGNVSGPVDGTGPSSTPTSPAALAGPSSTSSTT